MTTYYIEKDEKIVLHDTDKARLERTLKFLPQYQGTEENPLEILETERPIENGEWADTPEYIAKKQRRELEEQVAEKEAKTGLIRPMRENILADGSAYSAYTKAKAQEIETLAEQLRVINSGGGEL